MGFSPWLYILAGCIFLWDVTYCLPGPLRRVRSLQTPVHYTFNDPKWSQQWYMNEDVSHITINVTGAWRQNVTGENMVIGVVDDGVYASPEINLDPVNSWNVFTKTKNPNPADYKKSHGTQCASVAAGRANNSQCVVGVAFDAKIAGIKMFIKDLSIHKTKQHEADALTHNSQAIHVYSVSWGVAGGWLLSSPHPIVQQAMHSAARDGRGGKGSIWVWSAGNGGESDSCAYDGYQQSLYSIPVTAVDRNLKRLTTGEACSAVMATTFSAYKGSQDLMYAVASGGNGTKSCVSDFGNSSAAAPTVAGAIALALQKNPDLTWRDVHHLVTLSSNSCLDFDPASFFTNGAGYRVSPDFGFGLLNVGRMVELAGQWKDLLKSGNNVPDAELCYIKVENTINLSTLMKSPISKKLSLSPSCNIGFLEHVEVRLDMRYTRRGHVRMSLTSANGTNSVMLPSRPHDIYSDEIIHNVTTVHFWGEDPSGEWRIDLEDRTTDAWKADITEGIINSLVIVLHGTPSSPFRKPLSKCDITYRKGHVGKSCSSDKECPLDHYFCSKEGTCTCSAFYLESNLRECELDIGAIVGVIFGVIGIVLIVVAVWWYMYRRNKRRRLAKHARASPKSEPSRPHRPIVAEEEKGKPLGISEPSIINPVDKEIKVTEPPRDLPPSSYRTARDSYIDDDDVFLPDVVKDKDKTPEYKDRHKPEEKSKEEHSAEAVPQKYSPSKFPDTPERSKTDDYNPYSSATSAKPTGNKNDKEGSPPLYESPYQVKDYSDKDTPRYQPPRPPDQGRYVTPSHRSRYHPPDSQSPDSGKNDSPGNVPVLPAERYVPKFDDYTKQNQPQPRGRKLPPGINSSPGTVPEVAAERYVPKPDDNTKQNQPQHMGRKLPPDKNNSPGTLPEVAAERYVPKPDDNTKQNQPQHMRRKLSPERFLPYTFNDRPPQPLSESPGKLQDEEGDSHTDPASEEKTSLLDDPAVDVITPSRHGYPKGADRKGYPYSRIPSTGMQTSPAEPESAPIARQESLSNPVQFEQQL